MEIRTASVGEEAQIVRLINELIVELGGSALPVDDAVSTVKSFISGTMEGEIILAHEGADLVGVCTLTYQPSIRTLGRYGIIQEMYVRPEFRGENLGTKIIETAAAVAKSAGCSIVELGTPPDDERAEKFYRRVGFSQVGARMRCKL